ncbi:MAG: hypothetical protein WCT03_12525 [Candidatus Obscuribacterales bacterium]
MPIFSGKSWEIDPSGLYLETGTGESLTGGSLGPMEGDGGAGAIAPAVRATAVIQGGITGIAETTGGIATGSNIRRFFPPIGPVCSSGRPPTGGPNRPGGPEGPMKYPSNDFLKCCKKRDDKLLNRPGRAWYVYGLWLTCHKVCDAKFGSGPH